MDAAKFIAAECDAIKEVLLSKNAAYGNSALDPVRVFSQAKSTEQIRVRIDDKLSRLERGKVDHADGEDTTLDLIGYLVLLRIAERFERQCEEEVADAERAVAYEARADDAPHWFDLDLDPPDCVAVPSKQAADGSAEHWKRAVEAEFKDADADLRAEANRVTFSEKPYGHLAECEICGSADCAGSPTDAEKAWAEDVEKWHRQRQREPALRPAGASRIAGER